MKRFTAFNLVSIVLGFAFLYLPILLLVIYSFNESRLVTVWGGFSTKWYAALLQNEALLDAAWVTIRVALPLGDDRDRARHHGGDRAGPARPLLRAHALLRHGLSRRSSCRR